MPWASSHPQRCCFDGHVAIRTQPSFSDGLDHARVSCSSPCCNQWSSSPGPSFCLHPSSLFIPVVWFHRWPRGYSGMFCSALLCFSVPVAAVSCLDVHYLVLASLYCGQRIQMARFALRNLLRFLSSSTHCQVLQMSRGKLDDVGPFLYRLWVDSLL